MPNYSNYNSDNLEKARELRKNMTRHEKHLWYDFLCAYPIRFQRQRPIDNYILDFYCDKALLDVELDGSQHYEEEGEAYDRERERRLAGLGIETIRFSNYDIDRNFNGVCEAIDLKVKDRVAQLHPSQGKQR